MHVDALMLKSEKKKRSNRRLCTHSMTIMVLQKILLDCTEHHQAIITFFFLLICAPPIPHPCRFSSWMVVQVCDWWVNEDYFAVWADGEHWSACWQVAYSLLSELALSNTQRDTRKNTHLCTNTAAALSPNWYPEGFDGESERWSGRERERLVWKRKRTSKTQASWSAIYLKSTEAKNSRLM